MMSSKTLLMIVTASIASSFVSGQQECPKGWKYGPKNNKCFKLPFQHYKSKDHAEARDDCYNIGASLPMFLFPEEQFFEFQSITNDLMSHPGNWSFAWVDCTDLDKEGQWVCGPNATDISDTMTWHKLRKDGKDEENCLTVFRWPEGDALGYDDYSCTIQNNIRVVTVCAKEPCNNLPWAEWSKCSTGCGFATRTRGKIGESSCSQEEEICTDNPACKEGDFPDRSRYIGELALFAFDFAPEGWIPADGRLLNIEQHFQLFTLLSKGEPATPDLTSFEIPNKYSPAEPWFIAIDGHYPKPPPSETVKKSSKESTIAPSSSSSFSPSSSVSPSSKTEEVTATGAPLT